MKRGGPILFTLALLAVAGAGSFVLQRDVAGTITAALLLSLVWAALVAGAGFAFARRREGWTPVLAVGLFVAGLVGAGAFWFASVRDTTVDEDVVMAETPAAGTAPKPSATPANVAEASGSFDGADGHHGGGRATVIRTTGGERKLTFTDFDVSPGAKVEVWLTTGPDETGDRVELGALKGNVGDQQYDVPADADLSRYSTVVLYCTPFTVRIAVAPLRVRA